MRLVALEEHFLLPELAGTVAARPVLAPAMRERLEDFGAGRLDAMNAAGIDFQVLSHTTPGVQELPPHDAIVQARLANDALAAVVAARPDRFGGFAMLPTTAPAAAADELRRCCEELGMLGAMVNGQTQGRFLDHPSYRPLLAEAARLRVPIYLHPGLAPDAVRAAYFGGLDPAVAWYLGGAAWGWHAETGLHVLRMVVSGVFEELPDLTVVVGHLGEMLPFMFERVDEFLPPERTGLPRPVTDYLLTNVMLTTSGMFTSAPLMCALETFGAERLMFAVDHPYSSDTEAAAFLARMPITPEQRAAIAHGNADHLLRLGVSV
jgi:predicted TIM-barrel fold metal-dependent hydrolase